MPDCPVERVRVKMFDFTLHNIQIIQSFIFIDGYKKDKHISHSRYKYGDAVLISSCTPRNSGEGSITDMYSVYSLVNQGKFYVPA